MGKSTTVTKSAACTSKFVDIEKMNVPIRTPAPKVQHQSPPIDTCMGNNLEQYLHMLDLGAHECIEFAFSLQNSAEQQCKCAMQFSALHSGAMASHLLRRLHDVTQRASHMQICPAHSVCSDPSGLGCVLKYACS